MQLGIKKERASQVGTSGKEPTCQCRRLGFDHWVRVIPWRESMPLRCSCLENPMDRGAWRATVHRVGKSQTRLNTHTHTHANEVCNNMDWEEAGGLEWQSEGGILGLAWLYLCCVALGSLEFV